LDLTYLEYLTVFFRSSTDL